MSISLTSVSALLRPLGEQGFAPRLLAGAGAGGSHGGSAGEGRRAPHERPPALVAPPRAALPAPAAASAPVAAASGPLGPCGRTLGACRCGAGG